MPGRRKASRLFVFRVIRTIILQDASNCTGAVLRPVVVGMRLSGGRRSGVPDAPGLLLTDQMRANLDAALTQMGNARPAYRVVDLASFPANDPRRGYPTPTILYEGRDLFGMPTPVPPFPDPT